jgi:hypothetical protein
MSGEKMGVDGMCDGCLFWEVSNNPSVGLCHRFPPTLRPESVNDTPESVSWFPKTYAIEWCGEWRSEDDV